MTEKTIDQWREEINQLVNKSVNEATMLMVQMQEEILLAFIVKYEFTT